MDGGVILIYRCLLIEKIVITIWELILLFNLTFVNMKKSLFAFAVAVVMLTSCTSKEVTEIADNNVIKFDNAFVGKATRASIKPITDKGIDCFYVMGTKNSVSFFDNVKVYKQNESGDMMFLKQWESGYLCFCSLF